MAKYTLIECICCKACGQPLLDDEEFANFIFCDYCAWDAKHKFSGVINPVKQKEEGKNRNDVVVSFESEGVPLFQITKF